MLFSTFLGNEAIGGAGGAVVIATLTILGLALTSAAIGLRGCAPRKCVVEPVRHLVEVSLADPALEREFRVRDDASADALADAAGLPRPPRMTRAEAEATLSPMRLSFLSESRRIVNLRMKWELGLKLKR